MAGYDRVPGIEGLLGCEIGLIGDRSVGKGGLFKGKPTICELARSWFPAFSLI